MSFLENALQSFNAAAAAAQASTATAIDEGKTVLLAQSKNAAVEQEDTQKIDSTMALHHFGGKIVDFLDKYIDSDFGINDVVKRPAKARENTDDPEEGTEMDTIETQPPPPETPATVPEESAVVDPPVTTVDPAPADVIPDAPVDTVPDAPAPAPAPAEEEGLSEADLLPEGAGGVVGAGDVRSLLTRPSRLVQDQQEASAGDPVAPPPPAPTAGAGEAAADAEAAEAAAAAAESEEALALL